MFLPRISRLSFLIPAFAIALIPTAARAQHGAEQGQWRSYSGDQGSTKYSALDQINADNVDQLKVAWRWSSPENEITATNRRVRTFAFEGTPIMIAKDAPVKKGLSGVLNRLASLFEFGEPAWQQQGGVLYISTSVSQVAAIDAESGETLWVFEPKSYEAGRPTNLGFIHRGVAYWRDGDDERLFIGTGDSRLIALNAKTGEKIAGWGDGSADGEVDLTQGLRREIRGRDYTVSSPPIVCRDVVAVGSSIKDTPSLKQMPPGDVRGFDARTGEVRWTFESVAQPGQFGNDTWEDGSWEYTGNANVWTLMTADEELGYIYLPFGTSTNDWYGGHRLGDNLFAESLVCVDAATGERVWHYQTTHHGVWDYDLPAAPVLADITVDGKKIKALAQITKQGFTFVLDRHTGEPVWPIEEKAVPQSDIPGERLSPTQPHPTLPVAFTQQGVTIEDLADFTPEIRAEAEEILKDYHYGPLFTPPTAQGTINVPGWGGGGNWGGAALDPETGYLYVASVKYPIRVEVGQPNPNRSNMMFMRQGDWGVGGPRGLPLFKPPWASITAIDLNTGDHAWRIALGKGPVDHPALEGVDMKAYLEEHDLNGLGTMSRGYPLATKTLLFVAQEPRASRTDEHAIVGIGSEVPTMHVYDKATGDEICTLDIQGKPTGAPMTYMAGGRQFIILPAGGGKDDPAELIALALP